MEVEERFSLNDEEMIVGQLEIVNALDFLNKYIKRINKIILEVYAEYKVRYVFINLVDILNGYHLMYALDEASISFLEEKFKVSFNDGVYKENSIVLRKEIKGYLRTL